MKSRKFNPTRRNDESKGRRAPKGRGSQFSSRGRSGSFSKKPSNFSSKPSRGPRNLGRTYKDDINPLQKTAPKQALSPAVIKKQRAIHLAKLLQTAKQRRKEGLFLVEGEKTFIEAVEARLVLHTVFATPDFYEVYPEIKASMSERAFVVDEPELATIGTLAANKSVIGLFKIPDEKPLDLSGVTIALSGVSDPGNLGTIIRIADWYGIKSVVASNDTVDVYNPKTISATMGSFARVGVHYADLDEFFANYSDMPVIAADMRGKNARSFSFPKRGILLLGSESHGIAEELQDAITDTVTIPRIGGAESLNVAVAGAIILDNWMR